jgi:beta-glucanase (GH16 family)
MRLSWVSLLGLAAVALADTKQINCNADNPCPEDQPCCSQYGVCGTGAYCLGGCDIRFSYNLTACMPQPVMKSFKTTFDSTDKVESMNKYLGNASETDWVYSGYIDTNDDALLLQMPKDSVGTVISSSKYLYYGKVSATLKSSHDNGVVSAFILFSDVQDEIDFEFVGYNLTNPQTNYYWQGLLDYNNSRNYSVSNTFENYHTYEVDWHPDHIDWYIDSKKVRTLNKNDTYNATSKIYKYPQTPSRIQFSLWPGGASSNAPGTIEWAGGEINWDSQDIQDYGYYYSYLKEVEVTAYDLPDLKKVDDGDGDYDAFLYNSTEGLDSNVYLTNKKTYLGSLKDSGLEPNNESSSSSSASASESSSASKTSGSSSSTAANDDIPQGVGNGAYGNNNGDNDNNSKTNNDGKTNAATSTDEYTGGFMQNSNPTSSGGSSKSGSSSANNAGTKNTHGVVGILSGVVVGMISFLL